MCNNFGGNLTDFQRRPIIAPNINFWRQMIAAEEVEKGEATVKLITGRLSKPIPDVYLHRAVKVRSCAIFFNVYKCDNSG